MALHVYPRDLTETEWGVLAALLPPATPGGRPRSVDLRRIREWALFSRAQRLRLALSATRLWAVVHGLSLLPHVA